MKRILLIAALFSLALNACKDDGETPTPTLDPEPTNSEILVAGHWELNSGVINPAVKVDIFGTEVTISNYWDMLAALSGNPDNDCMKDNIMLFFADSTITLDEGPTKCDDTDPQTEDGGEWSFLENETKLKFTSFPYDPLQEERIMDVIELSSTDLKLDMAYTFVNPIDGNESDHLIELEFKNVK